MSHAVEILYESGPCLVVNKRPGILTQAPPGIDSLEVRLRALLLERESSTGNIYLAPPHRLDRPASGALAFTRHVRAARRLSMQFEDRTVSKAYWAFVEGRVRPDEGTWTDTLFKVHGVAQARVVPPDHPGGKRAVLHYRVLVANQCGTWLEIDLETGRTHQIRVQAASRGHPVAGDAQYGAATTFGPACEDARARAIALHAHHLGFFHPMTRESVAVVAPVPAAWHELDLPLSDF